MLRESLRGGEREKGVLRKESEKQNGRVGGRDKVVTSFKDVSHQRRGSKGRLDTWMRIEVPPRDVAMSA